MIRCSAAGDQRVASLMMWHFVEEIEHRSSGLMLYRHICPDPWYRTKHIRDTFSHVGEVSESIAKVFDEVVPFEDRGASAQELLSISLLYGEFTFRGPGGGRRRARRGGPPTLFSDVPDPATAGDGVAAAVVAGAASRPGRPAAAGLGGHLDAGIRPRVVDMTTFYPPAEKVNRFAVNELRRPGARG